MGEALLITDAQGKVERANTPPSSFSSKRNRR
jgi:hypothetical protein